MTVFALNIYVTKQFEQAIIASWMGKPGGDSALVLGEVKMEVIPAILSNYNKPIYDVRPEHYALKQYVSKRSQKHLDFSCWTNWDKILNDFSDVPANLNPIRVKYKQGICIPDKTHWSGFCDIGEGTAVVELSWVLNPSGWRLYSIRPCN